MRIARAGLLPLLIFFAGPAIAQSKEDMKNYMTYMTPGAQQQMLAKSAGDWNAKLTLYMRAGAPGQTQQLTGTNKMIMGGRFLESKATGTFMGLPFEGVGVEGYDNLRKVFVYNWMDNMGTGMMYMEGNYDPATKSIAFTGNMTDPVTGKNTAVRQVITLTDDNNQLYQMYQMQDGKEFLAMEIQYTRK